MKLSAEGVALIKSREACQVDAYQCPGNAWTIGYGHTGPEVHKGLHISAAEAESLLAGDLIIFDAAVVRLCPTASVAQHDAMVSLCFNIGIAAFERSSVMRLHQAGRYAEAAQAFALWNKARGRVLAGLVARRAEESALYLSDRTYETANASPIAQGEQELSASRTLSGTAISGTAVATLGLGEVTRQFDEWRDALSGLMPYFDQIKWLLLALTLAGTIIASYARWHDRRSGRS